MADLAIKFGTQSNFGTQTGWVAEAPTTAVTSKRAAQLGPTGNEAASKVFDEMTEYSQSFGSASSTVAPTIPATIGKLVGDGILGSITINTNWNDMVKMSLKSHNHTTNAHADTRKQGAHGITLSAAFGAIDFLGATAGNAATLESSTLEISCQHNDCGGGAGVHAAGENYNGHISTTSVWNGVPTTAVGAGWDNVSVVTAEDPTGALKTTVTGEKAVELATPI